MYFFPKLKKLKILNYFFSFLNVRIKDTIRKNISDIHKRLSQDNSLSPIRIQPNIIVNKPLIYATLLVSLEGIEPSPTII